MPGYAAKGTCANFSVVTALQSHAAWPEADHARFMHLNMSGSGSIGWRMHSPALRRYKAAAYCSTQQRCMACKQLSLAQHVQSACSRHAKCLFHSQVDKHGQPLAFGPSATAAAESSAASSTTGGQQQQQHGNTTTSSSGGIDYGTMTATQRSMVIWKRISPGRQQASLPTAGVACYARYSRP
jgi:hypothetical protein